jgi:hypothetical protein
LRPVHGAEALCALRPVMYSFPRMSGTVLGQK